MGIPSMGIYSYELFEDHDVKYAIRIGTAGSIKSDAKLSQIVFATSASNNKVSYNSKHFLPFRSKPSSALQIKGFLMLQGSLVALITPMNQDGSIHYEQLRDLIDWHIENGTDGIVAVGTTGESAHFPAIRV